MATRVNITLTETEKQFLIQRQREETDRVYGAYEQQIHKALDLYIGGKSNDRASDRSHQTD